MNTGARVVAVGVDEARQQRAAVQIDLPRTLPGPAQDLGGASHGANALALDAHGFDHAVVRIKGHDGATAKDDALGRAGAPHDERHREDEAGQE